MFVMIILGSRRRSLRVTMTKTVMLMVTKMQVKRTLI